MTRPDNALRIDAYTIAHQAPTIHQHLQVALRTLHDNQPGYPSGGTDGPGTTGDHSDRTGNLACGGAAQDPARRDRDTLDRLLHRIAADLNEAAAITIRWNPPRQKWRTHLASEAAATDDDTWCRSCARIGSMSPKRPEGGDLCRWCDDTARATDTRMPPIELVELHAQGRRITTTDIARAKRTKPKNRRAR